MASEQFYRESAVHALAGFQLIEEALKSYIGYYHETVRQCLPEKLTYSYSRQDVQDAALGKLVSVFGKVSSNDALILELRTLVKTRDDLAHKAFVNLYGPPPAEEDFEKRGAALLKVAERLGLILEELNKDSLSLVVIRPRQPTHKRGNGRE
jgi:hypothetical protein